MDISCTTIQGLSRFRGIFVALTAFRGQSFLIEGCRVVYTKDSVGHGLM